MNRKYEFTEETKTLPDGRTLHRIKSLLDTEYANAGELGGFIEKESNLPHDDISWVANESMVYGDAVVIYDSLVSDHAVVCDHAVVSHGAVVSGHARISGFSMISGESIVAGRCSLHYFTSAESLWMAGINHVLRKGKSDRLYSKSDIDYTRMKEECNMHPVLREALLSIIMGACGGIALGFLTIFFN